MKCIGWEVYWKMKELKQKWPRHIEFSSLPCQHITKNWNCVQQQALHVGWCFKTWGFVEQSIVMRKSRLFEWICHVWKNSISVDGQIVQNEDRWNSSESGMLISNAPVEDSCSSSKGSRTLHDKQWQRRQFSRCWFSREVARICETIHYPVCP